MNKRKKLKEEDVRFLAYVRYPANFMIKNLKDLNTQATKNFKNCMVGKLSWTSKCLAWCM